MAYELTGLPAPDVIQAPDYDEIVTRLVTRPRTINPDYTSIVQGDPAYSVVQAVAYEAVNILQRINDAAKAVLATHAIGADLDNIGRNFFIFRKIIQMEITHPYNFTVAKYINTTSLSDWNTKKGTEEAWSFVTDSNVKFMVFNQLNSDDLAELTKMKIDRPISIRSGDVGITRVLVTAPYDSTNNRIEISDYDTTQLEDGESYSLQAMPVPEILEADEPYRERVLDALEAIVPGSYAWYRGYTLEADGTVKNARPLKTSAGAITVYVQSTNIDPAAGASLLSTVKNYLHADNRRFIDDTVDVYSIGKRNYTLSANIRPTPGLDANAVLADVQKRAADFVKKSEIIGEPIYLSHIYEAILTESVREITLTQPTANIIPNTGDEDLLEMDITTYDPANTEAAFNALTGIKWGFLTINSVKYMVFKNITTADITKFNKLSIGSVIVIQVGGYELRKAHILSVFDETNNRIAIDQYEKTGLTSMDMDITGSLIPEVPFCTSTITDGKLTTIGLLT